MTQSRLLRLPTELRLMIWRELLCQPQSITLQIDYRRLHDGHCLEEVLRDAKAGDGLFSWCLPAPDDLPPSDADPRCTSFYDDRVKIKPANRNSSTRPILAARCAPANMLLVNKQMCYECSTIFQTQNTFDILVDMNLMFEFHGWKKLASLLSSNTTLKVGYLTITSIPRRNHGIQYSYKHLNWIYRPLSTSLIPLLLDEKFGQLRLDCYHSFVHRYGSGDNNYHAELSYPLDEKDLWHLEELHDGFQGRMKFQMEFSLYDDCRRFWQSDSERDKNEWLVLSRPDGKPDVPLLVQRSRLYADRPKRKKEHTRVLMTTFEHLQWLTRNMQER